MNKQERKLKGIYKFKKRLSNHHLSASIMSINSKSNLHAFKTTGKPCSCVMCSPSKTGEIRSQDEKRHNKFNTKEQIEEYFIEEYYWEDFYRVNGYDSFDYSDEDLIH